MDVTYEQFVQTFSAILSELEIARTVKVKLDVLFSNSDNDNDGSLSLAEFLGLLNQPDKDGKPTTIKQTTLCYRLRTHTID